MRVSLRPAHCNVPGPADARDRDAGGGGLLLPAGAEPPPGRAGRPPGPRPPPGQRPVAQHRLAVRQGQVLEPLPRRECREPRDPLGPAESGMGVGQLPEDLRGHYRSGVRGWCRPPGAAGQAGLCLCPRRTLERTWRASRPCSPPDTCGPGVARVIGVLWARQIRTPELRLCLFLR